jgi:hypothetical protein
VTPTALTSRDSVADDDARPLLRQTNRCVGFHCDRVDAWRNEPSPGRDGVWLTLGDSKMLSKGLVAALGIVVIFAFFGLLSSFAMHPDRVSQQPTLVQASHPQRADAFAGAFLPIVAVEASSPVPQWSPLTGDGSN